MYLGKGKKAKTSSKDSAIESLSFNKSSTVSFKADERLAKSKATKKTTPLRSASDIFRKNVDTFELQSIASKSFHPKRIRINESPSTSSESILNVEQSEVKYDEDEESEDAASDSIDLSSMDTELTSKQSEGSIFDWDPNFLDDIAYLPDVGDISFSSTTLEDEIISEESSDVTEGGRFTTLLDISRPHKPIEVVEELEEYEEEEEIPQEVQKASTTSTQESLSSKDLDFDEFDKIFEELEHEEEVHKPTDAVYEEAFPTLLGYEDAEDQKSDRHVTDEEQEERKKYIIKQTRIFLNELIDQCVAHSEEVFASKWLRKHLDKKKLMTAIYQNLALLHTEQWVYNYLHRKCVDHYRKAKCFRKITDNAKTIVTDTEKFHEVLMHLDLVLRKQQEVQQHSEARKIELKNQLEMTTLEANQEVEKLEQLMKQSLNPINSSRVETVINKALREMSSLRKQISNERFRIILHQHNVGSLMQQLNNVEYFGDNVNMKSYQTIQTEVTTLTNKLEEKTTELSRLQLRCNNENHAMAHLKEKQRMLRHAMSKQKQHLNELQREKHKLRQYYFNLKAQRSRIQKEMRDCSFQSGLLDKPILMADYDKTEQHLEILRDRVARIKQVIAHKISKIESLEENCNNNNNNNYHNIH